MRRSFKIISAFCLLIVFESSASAQTVVTWTGDTTIDGNKTTLSISYPIDSAWEIVLENDKTGTQTNDEINYSDSSQLSFSLSNVFDSTSRERKVEGTMSKDSLSISCRLFINDSINFPITLFKEGKNHKENSTIAYTNSFWWWLSFWIIFSLGMLLYFRGRKKYFPAFSNELIAIPPGDWLLKILPIVRISCRKTLPGSSKVLIVYNDSVFVFHKTKKASIDILHDEGSRNLINEVKGLKRIKQITIASIKKIEVEKQSRLGRVRFSIHHNNKKENFVFPGYEMPNLLKALQSKASNQLKTNVPIKFHSYGIWIKLFVLSFAAVFIYNYILQPAIGLKIIIYYFIFIILLIYILFLLFSSVRWFMDHAAQGSIKQKIQKQNPDLSHRKPFRSVPLAIFLKVVGASIFIFTFLLLKQELLPLVIKKYILSLNNYFNGFLVVAGYLLVGLILNLSLAFANKNPKLIKQNNAKPPILYLRSFLDDRETTFQPGTWLSYFLGVDPPYFQLSKYTFITDSLFYRFNRKILKYLYNNHPVRMLRLILGWPADTSEQQLELYFRKKGPFVAIGKPGERIITSGAGRMYVTNEEWQNVIIDYLHKSQLVVLQPSSTEGIWWEINQSLNIINPKYLLLCMINYKAHQNSYEDFRLRFENVKDEIKLPRFIGNTNEICFFRFDAEWKPILQRLRYRNFIYWPFLANAADLKKSLEI